MSTGSTSKKEAAISFLKMVVARNIKAAYDKYIAPDFIHHNQYFKGDRQSLLDAMEEAHAANPNTTIDVRYAYEDGDTVITHSFVRHDTNSPGIAVVHIFRFKGGQVVELWDLGQMIEKDSPNENGLF